MTRGTKKGEDDGIRVICRNKRAYHDYEILESLECGVILTGTEVKSLRDGHASLEDAYAKLDGTEVWLIGSDVPFRAKLPVPELLIHGHDKNG